MKLVRNVVTTIYFCTVVYGGDVLDVHWFEALNDNREAYILFTNSFSHPIGYSDSM